MPLNSLKNSYFGDFVGLMAQDTWAWGLLRGSPQVLEHLYCHQMIT